MCLGVCCGVHIPSLHVLQNPDKYKMFCFFCCMNLVFTEYKTIYVNKNGINIIQCVYSHVVKLH